MTDAHDPEPPSGDDMRVRLVSDRVGRLSSEELLAFLRAAPAPEPSVRSKRQTDVVERGKTPPPGPKRRLTDAEREQILAACAAGRATQVEIAARFGVSQSAVSAIVRRAASK